MNAETSSTNCSHAVSPGPTMWLRLGNSTKRAPRIRAAISFPSCTGTAPSSRECSTRVGQLILGSISRILILGNSAIMRAAFSGEEEMRCRSLSHDASPESASGRNSVVHNCRKAGLSRPQPERIRVSIACRCSCAPGPGAGQPFANVPLMINFVTRSGWRTA